MIELQTNIVFDAVEKLEWTWLNHDIPLWVTFLFAFTNPSAWSSKLTALMSNVLGMAQQNTETVEDTDK